MVLSARALIRLSACTGRLGAAFSLGGCIETGSDLKAANPGPALAHSTGARRANVSPGGASVALTSLEGPPQAVGARFAQAFVAEAGAREIQLTEAKTARYLVRGYLTAYPAQGGTALAYVWDIYDAGKQRAQRLTDGLIVKGAAADPWSLIDDKALVSIAAKSADDLAAFLTNTPEAIAAAKSARPALAAAAPAGPAKPPARPLGYAPVD